MMRMASSPDFKKSIEASQAQLRHGHAMLARIMLVSHDKIHAAAEKSVLAKSPNILKDMPDMAEAAIVGQCLYNMIAYSFVVEFGMKELEESRKTFPELDQ